MTALPEKEKLARLRLIRTDNVGPITFNRLLERFGSAQKALEALPDLAKRGGHAELKAFPQAKAEDEIATVAKVGARLIYKGEAEFPTLLNEIDDAAPVLTVLGRVELLNKPALGVVGARNASLTGRKIAEDFSGKTGQAGYVIASGLARGIDSAAHKASLATGTIAVVAGGVDVIYPPENDGLYRQIAETGAVVAECAVGSEPLARHFPRRNRIISGLSLGVLVVEAAAKSGSLITARMALEQNREVFAVPGSPLDPRAEGTNSLIRDGAHMATSANDILQVLKDLRMRGLREPVARHWSGEASLLPANDETPPQGLQGKILEILSPVPVSMDELIRAVEAPAGEVLTAILELELAGRIERQAGNRVNLI